MPPLVVERPFLGPAHLPLTPGKKLAVIGPNGNCSFVFAGSYYAKSCPEDTSTTGKIRGVGCLPTVYGEVARLNGAGEAGEAGGSTSHVSGCSVDHDSPTEERDHTQGTRREPFSFTPMGVDSIPCGSPPARPMGRTCGEPHEIKNNTHPEKIITAPFGGQACRPATG